MAGATIVVGREGANPPALSQVMAGLNPEDVDFTESTLDRADEVARGIGAKA